MPKDLPTSLRILRNQLSSEAGWTWFIEISRAAAAGGGKYRLCDADRKISANGKTWVPAALRVDTPPETSDGAIGEMSVTIPNVSRVAIGELEAGNLQGRPITVRLEHESDFASFRGALEWSMLITKATATAATVTLSCSHPLALDRMPARVFDRSVAPAFGTQASGGGRDR